MKKFVLKKSLTVYTRKPRRRKQSNYVPDPDDALRRVRRGRGDDLLTISLTFRRRVKTRTGRAGTRPFWRWYHVPCWLRSNTHTRHSAVCRFGRAAFRVALCCSVSGGTASTNRLCPRANAAPDLRW